MTGPKHPEINRWVYCKYCYINVRSNINHFERLVECSK